MGIARIPASGYNKTRTWTEKAIRCNSPESALIAARCVFCPKSLRTPEYAENASFPFEADEIRRVLPIQSRQGHRNSVLKQGGTAKFSASPLHKGRGFLFCTSKPVPTLKRMSVLAASGFA